MLSRNSPTGKLEKSPGDNPGAAGGKREMTNRAQPIEFARNASPDRLHSATTGSACFALV
jgi:hypothetical protein